MKKPNESLKAYRHNLEREARPRLTVLGQTPSSASTDAEFAPGAGELVVRGQASRRKFMGILGASTALAGLSSGCIRKPVEHIFPYAKRPEDSLPGKALYYATSLQIGATVHGLLVETHEGRPTKVEGNPSHPANRGKTDAFAQATILGLYDPERSREPMSRVLQAQLVLKSEATQEQAKELVINKLCSDLYEHVLGVSKSTDRARTASDKCRADAAAAGASFKLEAREEEGKKEKVAQLAVPSEVAMSTTAALAWHQLDALFTGAQANASKLAFVITDSLSPSYRAQLAAVAAKYRGARFYVSDPAADSNRTAGARMLAGDGVRQTYSLKGAKTIAAFDADFLGVESDSVRLSREWAAGRKVAGPKSGKRMSRLYAVEPHFTPTGAAADHRLAIRGTDIVAALTTLVTRLAEKHKLADGRLPQSGLDLLKSLKVYSPDAFGDRGAAFFISMAKDLAKHKDGKAVIVVGERQPPEVHALAALANTMLGAVGSQGKGLMQFHGRDFLPTKSLSDLAADLETSIDTVVCLGTNPAYDAPGSLGLADKLSKVKTLVHFGIHRDETAQIATWHLPVSHAFESWGDLQSVDGTLSIAQPLIAPLYETSSLLEVAARIATPGKAADGAELVRAQWRADDKRWRKWLHVGVGDKQAGRPALVNAWPELGKALTAPREAVKGWEVNFHLDPCILDGRFSNNGWMQELPHPMSKVTWDNAAYINPVDAESMGVKNGDFLAIKLGERSAAVPAWIAPGQARKTISVNLGYGRKKLGSVADGAGFDVYKLRNADAPSFEIGSVESGAGDYLLASTQDYGYLDPDGPAENAKIIEYKERPIYREATVADYKKRPKFSQDGDLMPPERLHSLWDHPVLTGKQQWGMSIDLNLCTGCNACTAACGAENNIPVVGKDMVANGRELHWIRIDRYYRDFSDQPRAVVMPVGCMHCETAPCENVCPVQATAHSPEGLNDMAYNRCLGTRYCANNCPYKVRRFNFFNFNLDIDPVSQMQKNPNVTIRFRGVIEKCSYCVQRINAAKIDAHVAGEEVVKDGVIVTACEQACPTSAITFGDIANPESRVSKLKKQPRDYDLLSDLLTLPRTSYLARVTNPNPTLADFGKPKDKAKAKSKGKHKSKADEHKKG